MSETTATPDRRPGADTIRILHLHSGNLYGGIETLLATLARRRADAPGIDPGFALCFPGRLADELAAAGVPPTRLPSVRLRNPLAVLRSRRALARRLAAEPPDLVVTHSPWSHCLFAPTVRRAGLRLVFWMHGAAAKTKLERWASRTPPDLVLANSDYTASTAPKLFGGTPVRRLYLPVDSPRPADPVAVAALRTELGATEKTRVVLMVSRMEALKGHRTLLEALALMADRRDWLAWLVGSAQRPEERRYESSLHRQAGRLGIADRVLFLGQRHDLGRLFAAADLYCQPNHAPDAFGIVFIEALYAGLPVVTSPIGGAREIVDERCGRLVETGNAAALSAALTNLLDDDRLRHELGEAGPERARRLCDPATRLGELSSVLHALLSRPGAVTDEIESSRPGIAPTDRRDGDAKHDR